MIPAVAPHLTHARLLLALLAQPLALSLWVYLTMVRMPGASYAGPFEPLTPSERALEAALRRDVAMLAGHTPAADHLDAALVEAGYVVSRRRFDLEAERPGSDPGIVLVGARYPSAPGADDDVSGVAALLAVARAFADKHPRRTVRFVAFANEPSPPSQTPSVRSREPREDIVAMLGLETLGHYTDRPNSQRYPFPLGLLYPSAGDFVAFIGDHGSADLVRRTVDSFRRSARFPSEGLAAPTALPGVGSADHRAFWQEGYPAVVVTDTAPLRDPRSPGLTYAPLARVVSGLIRVIEDLAAAPAR